jgi:hypothetical protein
MNFLSHEKDASGRTCSFISAIDKILSSYTALVTLAVPPMNPLAKRQKKVLIKFWPIANFFCGKHVL